LIFDFTSLWLFALKFDFAALLLIGMRAAPGNKAILRPLEQNLAPERYKKWILQKIAPGRIVLRAA
jgi:hypothetical protein